MDEENHKTKDKTTETWKHKVQGRPVQYSSGLN